MYTVIMPKLIFSNVFIFQIGNWPLFLSNQNAKKDLNETGNRISIAMYFKEVYFIELLIMQIGVGGPFAIFWGFLKN